MVKCNSNCMFLACFVWLVMFSQLIYKWTKEKESSGWHFWSYKSYFDRWSIVLKFCSGLMIWHCQFWFSSEETSKNFRLLTRFRLKILIFESDKQSRRWTLSLYSLFYHLVSISRNLVWLFYWLKKRVSDPSIDPYETSPLIVFREVFSLP